MAVGVVLCVDLLFWFLGVMVAGMVCNGDFCGGGCRDDLWWWLL